jgi:hypothetical protein
MSRPGWARTAAPVGVGILVTLLLNIGIRGARKPLEIAGLVRYSHVVGKTMNAMEQERLWSALDERIPPAGPGDASPPQRQAMPLISRKTVRLELYATRIGCWREAILFLSENPRFWILGTGIGNYGFYTMRRAGSRLMFDSQSLFLQTVVETGVLGLAAFLFLVLGLFRRSWRAWKKSVGSSREGVQRGVLAALAAFLMVHLLSDSRMQIYAWAFLGLAAVWSEGPVHEKQQNGQPA